MEDASGYNPFNSLLYVKNIDEKWKRMADMAMRKIIQDEVAGKTKPREDWERALHCYARIIQAQLYCKLKYSRELFADQMQFLVDDQHFGNHLIDNYHVGRIFSILSGSEYKELRHRIARFVVMDDKEEFSRFFVYSKGTSEAANQMMTEFGDSDSELADKLKKLIKEGGEREAESANHNNREKEVEENILAQMK